jgi:hypothetical protein
LAKTIQEYRRQLQPQRVTDEKIVDSIIWAFVCLLRKGALPKGQVTYLLCTYSRLLLCRLLLDYAQEVFLKHALGNPRAKLTRNLWAPLVPRGKYAK